MPYSLYDDYCKEFLENYFIKISNNDISQISCINNEPIEIKAKKIYFYDEKPYYKSAIELVYEDIDRVIFNEPATIVFWKSGGKTVVKSHKERYDREKGLLCAIVKHMFGDDNTYHKIFKDFC